MAKKGEKFKKYSSEQKIAVILDMREHHLGYKETARKYGLVRQSEKAAATITIPTELTENIKYIKSFEYEGKTITVTWKSDKTTSISNFGVVKRGYNDELVKLTKARIGEKPLEFRVNIAPDIPEYLNGDYIRLKQIAVNLLTNAVKYTKKGFIEFNVSCVKKDNICRLIMSVKDSGIGIKKENMRMLDMAKDNDQIAREKELAREYESKMAARERASLVSLLCWPGILSAGVPGRRE